MPEIAPVQLNRTERALVGIIAALVTLSMLGIVGTMIGAGTGAAASGGVWPALLLMGYAGLPIAFLLVVVVLVMSTTRRRRHGRDGRDGER